MITLQEIKDILLAELPGAEIQVSDMTGTNDHFEIHVAAKQFQELSLIEQHKKVLLILEGEMDENRIHAVKLKTKALN